MNLQKNCTNCGNQFEQEGEFCASCGQSRANYNTNFITLLKDYINEAFGIDSKIKHTYKYFFYKPEFLTEEFLRGRRQHYVHPIRLYLICSLFFLFIFNNFIIDKHSFKIDIDKFLNVKDKLEKEELSDIKINIGIDNNIYYDSVNIDSTSTKSKNPYYDNHYYDKKDNDKYDRIVTFIRNNKNITDLSIEDSLGIKTWYGKKLIKQAKYFYDEKGVTFFQAAVENIPIAIMLLVPIFAFYLKLLYIRSKENLYIQHLIFSVHLHSFTLFIFGLILIFGLFKWDGLNYINSILLCYWFVIILLMLKKFYKQKWSKTIIKFFLSGVLHSIVISMVIVFELLISLLLF